jgi:hypothetical protein
MERALSLRAEAEAVDRPVAAPQTPAGFELRQPDVPVDAAASAGPVGATVDAGSIASGVDAAPDEELSDNVADSAIDAEIGRAEIDDDGDREESTEQRENRFTTIEEARRWEELRHQPEHPLISAPTWMLIAAIVATGIVVWYMLQPPSADQLFTRIAAAAGEEDDKRLLDVETEVKAFIEHYPGDSRAPEIRRYQRQINALRLERRAKLQARLLNKRYPDSPIGRDYLAAIELAETDPENAVIRLQSLLDLYGQSPQSPVSISVFLVAADRQLQRIQEQIERRAAMQTALLEQRLKSAYQSLEDDPQETERICRAIVILYQNKPWAEDIVARAKATLAVLEEK